MASQQQTCSLVTFTSTQCTVQTQLWHLDAYHKCDGCAKRKSSSSLCLDHQEEINLCTMIFKNIIRQLDQKKARTLAMPSPCLITEFFLGCRDLSLPSDSWCRELELLMICHLVLCHLLPHILFQHHLHGPAISNPPRRLFFTLSPLLLVIFLRVILAK